jgi:nucleoside-diphosphate-sugar epimerase
MGPRPKVLLIGCGGFVGPWIGRALLRHEFEVMGLARRVPASAGFCTAQVDVTAPGALDEWVKRADAVVFNAGYLPKNYADIAEAEACLRTNALAVLAVLATRPARFVYISTGQGYCPTSTPARETDPLFPSARASYYLGSKLLGDLYTEHHRVVHGLATTVLRLGALYGANMRSGMVATFIRQSRAGQSIRLQDGGGFSSDLTWVGDVGEAVAQAVKREVVGVFNIGSGRATSAFEAAHIIVQTLSGDSSLIEVEPRREKSLLGFPALNVDRARRELGFAPTPVDQGLSETARTWSEL